MPNAARIELAQKQADSLSAVSGAITVDGSIAVGRVAPRYPLRGAFDGHRLARTVTVGRAGTTVHGVLATSVP